MTATYATFVAVFPEFSNATAYPEAGINFWLTTAYQQLNAFRFGTQLDLAAMLFVAHNTVLAAQNAAAAATPTGIVGQTSAPLQSKTVGPVSASYDTQAVVTEGAGIYNATSYGQRLYKLMQQYCGGSSYVPGPRRFGLGAFGPPFSRRGFGP